ncbi:MAG: hypothetical protein QXF41_01500 [Candidatus Micrarchaeaceae archaeon]
MSVRVLQEKTAPVEDTLWDIEHELRDYFAKLDPKDAIEGILEKLESESSEIGGALGRRLRELISRMNDKYTATYGPINYSYLEETTISELESFCKDNQDAPEQLKEFLEQFKEFLEFEIKEVDFKIEERLED